MGKGNLKIDKNSLAWPLYQAMKADGISDDEINRGYRAINYKAGKIFRDDREWATPANELRDIGEDLTEPEVLEYAFDNYGKYRNVIKDVTGHLAPWDFQGRMSTELEKKIDGIVSAAGDDPWKAIDGLFTFLRSSENEGLGFEKAADCPIESDAIEAHRMRCGLCTEQSWLLGAMILDRVTSRFPDLKVGWLQGAYVSSNFIPTKLNHAAMSVQFGGRRQIVDPAHGQADNTKLLDALFFFEQSPRQAFAAYLSQRSFEMARMGMGPTAFPMIDMAERIDPENASILHNHGVILMNIGGPLRALEASNKLERAIDLSPEDPRSYFSLGSHIFRYGAPHLSSKKSKFLNEKLGKKFVKSAIKCFRKVIELEPDHIKAHFGLGKALVLMKEFAEAKPHLINAVDEIGAPALMLLGYCHFEESRLDDALKAAEKAVSLDPNIREAYILLKDIYSTLGRKEKTAWAEGELERLNARRSSSSRR